MQNASRLLRWCANIWSHHCGPRRDSRIPYWFHWSGGALYRRTQCAQLRPSFTNDNRAGVLFQVLNLLGFICITVSTHSSHSRGGWFNTVAMGGFWFTGILLVLYLFHIVEKFSRIPWLKIVSRAVRRSMPRQHQSSFTYHFTYLSQSRDTRFVSFAWGSD